MVGEGLVTAHDLVWTVYPELKTRQQKSDNIIPISRRAKVATEKKDRSNAIPIRGLASGVAVHFAGCCHPLPGDRIVGIVATGKGVTIHTIDCVNLDQYNDTPERWLDVAWEDTEGAPYVGRITLMVSNESETLGELTTVIAKNMGYVSNLRIANRAGEFCEVIVDVEVRDVKHLTNIIAALRAAPAISSVERARN